MSTRFTAILRGSEEVPPVQTNATGEAEFLLDQNAQQLRYRLVVNNIRRFREAHIHLGRRGENGPIVVFLFGPVMPGITVNQGIVEGIITAQNFIGPLQGQPFSALVSHMVNRNTYVNVHTAQHPAGEIRGQIMRVENGNGMNGNNNGTNDTNGNNASYQKW